jgi:hypothetical protein
LYHHGESHRVIPIGDPPAKLDVEDERAAQTTYTAGVGNIGPSPTGKLEAQVQRNDKINYQTSMRAWREGLSYESLDQNHATSRRAVARNPAFDVTASHRHLGTPRKKHFHVNAGHAYWCKECPKVHRRRCIWRETSNDKVPKESQYDKAAHWEWEVNLKLGYWAPEIYESFTRGVTVIREVPVSKIPFKERDGRVYYNGEPADIAKYLHFDFAVVTRLRHLRLGLRDLLPSAWSRPAELRARSDTGALLAPDRATFCISCCKEMIDWPKRRTRDRQKEADDEVGCPNYLLPFSCLNSE